MLKSLRNIQGAFALSRFYLIGITLLALGVSAYAIFQSYQFAEKQREKVYVLDNGKSLMLALSQDVYMNKSAEAKAHVKWFHELFFTLAPDGAAIEDNVKQALFLADNSALEFYKTRQESGYYQKMIGAGIINEIRIDSICLNMDVYPYTAKTYAVSSIMRRSSVSYYRLITSCELINSPRSDNNPHGFIINNWQVNDMTEIKSVQR
ncbi:MAG: conjugative transposon protein TraK [Paludibacteraceae bacterium]|nr:conjugative transposon protein TraK [Paludibacteraceae bacterium]MBR6658941.1 conjugative transposon protein TraK [Paludibacteraceae bacterium]